MGYRKIIDYFVAIMFVVTSGAVFYVYVLSPAISYMLLLLIGIFNKVALKVGNKDRHVRHNTSWMYIIFVCVIALLGDLYYQHSYDDRNLMGYIVILLAAYIIISTYNFQYFRKLLTNIVFFIVLLGIPIFTLSEYDLLPTTSIVTSHGDSYTMFLCYTLGWPNLFHRFSGIWHEPGACQIVLNTILWLHFKEMVTWNWEKKELIKILVITIGSIITFSTGSYLSLMLLFLSVAINLKLRTKNKVGMRMLFALTLGIAVYFIFNSDTVQNKLFREDTEESKMSTVARTADAIALWEMTKERPLLGYGLGSHAFWTTSTSLGNTANSSGLLTFSASFGMIWLLIFVITAYIRMRKLGFGKASVLLLLAVLIMQFNEKYIEYPITNIFIFSFGTFYIAENKDIYGKTKIIYRHSDL